MNKKGFVRVLEAFLASAIMVIAATFIASEQAGTVEPPTPGEIVRIKQIGNDVLAVLENNIVMYEGNEEKELALYIRTKDQYSLSERLEDIIPRDYTYKLDIYKIENLYVISTNEQAAPIPSGLTNGYIVTGLTNYNDDIWHYSEEGYIFDLPDISDRPVTILVVDSTQDETYNAFDYDAFYINFDNDTSFDYNEDLPANPTVSLKSRDFFRIYDSSIANIQYELEFLISEITPDGNSVSVGLVNENIVMNLDGSMMIDYVSVMGEVYHFKVTYEKGRYWLYYDKNDANDADPAKREYKGPYKEGDWIIIEEYDVCVDKIDDKTIYLNVLAYRKRSMSVSTLIPAANLVVCNRVLAVKEGENVNFYYVRIVLGRRPS